jgi:hypothetical protein
MYYFRSSEKFRMFGCYDIDQLQQHFVVFLCFDIQYQASSTRLEIRNYNNNQIIQ